MHHPPDLSLASSYIPACLCLLKCTAAFVLFIFSPVRGWIGLVSILLTDRILWNQAANSSILDVNAVCVSLVGGLMVVHARVDGIRTLVHFTVTGAWILLSSLQILGVTRLYRAYEVLYAAFAVSVLSCLFQTQERTELLALRSFMFVVANVTLPYLGVMLQHADIDTYVNVCRTLLILLGEPELASAWIAVYILCIGYQVHNSASVCAVNSRKGRHTMKYAQHQIPFYSHNNAIPSSSSDDYDDETPPQHSADNCINDSSYFTKHVASSSSSMMATQPTSITSSIPTANNNNATSSEEASLLREALASRKGLRDA